MDESRALALAARFSDNAIIVTNAEQLVEWVNPGFEALSGYSLAEMKGRNPSDVLRTYATSQQEINRMERALAQGLSTSGDLVNYHKLGHPFWVSTDIHPIHDEGRITSFLGISRDVTEQKRNQSLLAGRTAVLEALAEGASLADAMQAFARALDEATPEMHVGVTSRSAEGRLHGIAAPMLPQAYMQAVDGIRAYEGCGTCGTAAHRRARVVSEDILSDPLWAEQRELARLSGMRACWSQPIKGADGALLGVLALYFRHARQPSDSELAFLEEAADVAAVAIERKRLEDEANRAAEAYRLMFENMPVGLGRSNRDGRWVDVNPALARMFGYDSPRQMLAEVYDIATQHDKGSSAPVAIKARIDALGEVRGEIIRATGRDGRRLWVRVDIRAIHDASGTIQAYDSAVVDVTAETEARDAVARSERLLRTMADALPPLIAYLDDKQRYKFINAAYVQAKGLDRDAVIGRRLDQALPADWYARIKPHVEAVLRGETVSFQDTMPVLTADDAAADESGAGTSGRAASAVDVQASYVPDISESGEVQGFFALITDVSEYKRREAELVQARDDAEAASRAKSSFLATMSHELRTPLNAILGYSEMMEREVFGPLGHEKYKDYVGDILTSGRHLFDMISAVLALAHGEVKGGGLETEPVNLLETAGEAVRMSTHSGSSAVSLDVPQELTVEADPRALRQIVINLVDNALKYAPEASVTVSGRQVEGRCRLTVRDTGEGVPPDHLEDILSPFNRGAHDAAVAGPSGMGIGLPLVKRLVEAQSGTLRLDSALGEGFTVTIDLPLARSEGMAAE